jgi:ELWxxDGT repeat protein
MRIHRLVGLALLVAAVVAVVAAAPLAALPPAFQVVDLNTTVPDRVLPSTVSGAPVAIGSTVYFVADDHIHGTELWKSDGTDAGTVLVKDICPGYCAGRPSALTALGGVLYFAADDGAHGRELWRSDGTAAGTFLVKDINPGLAGAVYDVVAWNGRLVLVADDGQHGYELWVSDGTASGTVLLADVNPGPQDSYPRPLALGTSLLLFIAWDAQDVDWLWITDGTAAGTHKVAGSDGVPLNVGLAPYSPAVVLSGNIFLFKANYAQLWRTDGTPSGTVMVRDFAAAGTGAYPPEDLVAWNGRAFFSAGTASAELWTSDGTAAGTVRLATVRASELTVAAGRLFFNGYDSAHGNELWSSDGTAAGTGLVKDIYPGGESSLSTYRSQGHGFVALPTALLFFADDGVHGAEPWRSDGTAAGTTLVADIIPGQLGSFLGGETGSIAVGATAFFFVLDAQEPLAPNLWKSDGTAAGTARVKRLTGVASSIVVSDGGLVASAPWVIPGETGGVDVAGTPFAPLGDHRLLFAAEQQAPVQSLCVTDGSAAGSRCLAYRHPRQMVPFAGAVVFADDQGVWSADGIGGTVFLGGSGTSQGLTPTLQTLYFSDLSANFESQLWQSDGTAAGTRATTIPGAATQLGEITPFGNRLLFTAAGAYGFWPRPWISDGTAAGSQPLAGSNATFSDPTRYTVVGDVAYFAAYDPTNGNELWKTDGTPAGTAMVVDLNPGNSSALLPAGDPTLGAGAVAVAFQGQLFFAANDGSIGEELWRSDGTPGGTQLVRDISPGAGSSQPRSLTVAGGKLFFIADDGVHGRELWVSDGTAFGTMMLRDIMPGPDSSVPQQVTAVGTGVLFSAADPVSGRELWVSDGTPAGTRRLQDIAPGALPSSPMGFTVAGPLVYFAANDGTSGFELWAVPLSALPIGGSLFYTLEPCRLIDTRSTTAPLLFGVPRTFAAAGSCGIPPTAKALAVNVTLTAATSPCELELYAAGAPDPGINSASCSPQTARATNSLVQLAAGGFTALLNSTTGANGGAYLIVDVSGWFE